MATIVINDLEHDADLDREAMKKVAGGKRIAWVGAYAPQSSFSSASGPLDQNVYRDTTGLAYTKCYTSPDYYEAAVAVKNQQLEDAKNELDKYR